MCGELLYSINTLTPSSTAFDFCSIHEERNIAFPEPLKKKKWFWWLADWSRVNTELFWGQGQKGWRPAFANQASSALLSFFGESNHITCLPLTCTGLRQSRSNLEPFHVWQCWTIRTPAQETITAPLVRHRSWGEAINALPKAHGNCYINNSMATKCVKGHFSVTKENHLKALLLAGSC